MTDNATLAGFHAEQAPLPSNDIDRASDHRDPEWFLMDGMPGSGPRPEYLMENFKNLAEQAKAYPSLRKTLGAQKGAPEEYAFGDLQEHIDRDNKVIKEFMIYAKENRLSQDAFEQTMKTYVDYERSKLPDVDAEIAKLGPDGITKVKTAQTWAKNTLSPKALKALEALPVRAEIVEMLDELRQQHIATKARLPVSEVSSDNYPKLTREMIETEMWANYKRYREDPTYRADISRKLQQVMGED